MPVASSPPKPTSAFSTATTPPRTPTRSKPASLETPSPSRQRRSELPQASPTPSKLRRKATVEDALESAAGVQRLVEYFLVISCHPRWEHNNNKTKGSNAPTTPEPKRPEARRSVSVNTIAEQDTRTDASETNPTKSRRSKNAFWKRDKTKDSSTSDTQMEETREEVLPAPKPSGTWTRETQDSVDGNIHLPQHVDNDFFFQPKITARFPNKDHRDSPLNPMVTQFCYPIDDVIVPTKEYQMPRVHHFVLTNDKGRKVYGTCLTIYEEYEPPIDAPWRSQDLVHSDSGERDIEVTVDNQQSTLYLPRCLCILSIWPYMNAFREYLSQLYRLATATDCMEAPIERFILNICMEIPAPPPGAFEVQINILDSIIRFWSPPAKLPIAYVALPYRILFECLDVQNILHLWYCLTMEQKVLLVSSQYSILTVCAEILCSLLYPMKWSHLYVPLLPRFLCPMLDAPVPYLCGVTRDNWLYVQQFVSDETIVVDLDRNSVMFGPATSELPALPGKKWTKLQRTLNETVGNIFLETRGLVPETRSFKNHPKRDSTTHGATIKWNEKLSTFDQAFNLQYTPDSANLKAEENADSGQNVWDRVQEAFLRFFVAMLKDYRGYLQKPSTADQHASTNDETNDWLRWNQGWSFDRDSFIASQKAEYHPFLSQLVLTQQFDDFITKRLYSPEMPDIIFFDQSIDAKLNRSRLKIKKVDTPFLQSAKTHKVLKTFCAIAPNTAGTEESTPYIYSNWPETLDPKLFGRPRPIPTIITAEFDRQADLVSRLRSNHADHASDNSHIFELYGNEYDTSPEGMTFTVFFYAYAAIIGREWQAYQHKQRELDAIPNNQIALAEPKLPEEEVVSEEAQPKLESESKEIEVYIGESRDIFNDLSLGLCEQCPDGTTTINNALIYVAANPCPRQIDEINVQAQNAYETLSNFTNSSLQYLQNPRSASLLDDDDGFAEYEEARAVAVAQLDLAFDTLKTMEMRGLSSDPDVFRSLMEACGRCGDTKRALELIETMKRDGLAADQEVLSCFMTAFARNSGDDASFSQAAAPVEPSTDAYSNYLQKKMESVSPQKSGGLLSENFLSDSESMSSASDMLSSSGSEISSGLSALKQPLGAAGLLEWLAPGKERAPPKTKKRKRRKRRASVVSTQEPATDRLRKQIVLGKTLLDFLYPDLIIDTGGDACSRCSHIMNEEDIIDGWRPCAFDDFTTCCPKCSHRFVPHFSISCGAPSFAGSQGMGTPLYCEFLSPWVLRKELDHLIDKNGGIDMVLNPEWRSGTDIRATIWWNLIAMFQRYEIPVSFLLQGSFQNRLINPVPQD